MLETVTSILVIAWYIAFGILGIVYIILWVNASNHCKNKWVMLTPFWVFMKNSFDEEGIRICRQGLIVIFIGLAMYVAGEVLGFI